MLHLPHSLIQEVVLGRLGLLLVQRQLVGFNRSDLLLLSVPNRCLQDRLVAEVRRSAVGEEGALLKLDNLGVLKRLRVVRVSCWQVRGLLLML